MQITNELDIESKRGSMMIDNTRIKSGYDVEVLLGSEYFLNILKAAYRSGEMPSENEIDDNVNLEFGEPSSLVILADRNDADIEATIQFTLVVGGIPVLSQDSSIGIFLTITTNAISFEYSYLDDSTQETIRDIELATGTTGLLEEVENSIREAINRDVAFDFLSVEVAELKIKKLSSDIGYQAAFGLYVNLPLKVVRLPLDPDAWWPRGSLIGAVSFLPNDRSFAIGFGDQTFARFATDTLNSLGVRRADGSVHYPLMEGDKITGKFTRIQINPRRRGNIRLVVNVEYFLEGLPNADVTAKYRLTPYIENGEFSIRPPVLIEFVFDIGFLGVLIPVLSGNILGAILSSKFGLGYEAAGAVEGEIGDAFLSIPDRITVSNDQRDPFFNCLYDLVNQYVEVKVDTHGMSLAGNVVLEAVNEPTDVMIIDKMRGQGANSWNGLVTLTYHTQTHGDIEMEIHEVLRRVPLREIARVGMNPTHIRREESVVSDIRFSSGLDLFTSESVALQTIGALVVNGYQLIREYQKQNGLLVSAHYRARANDQLDDNFESLPQF